MWPNSILLFLEGRHPSLNKRFASANTMSLLLFFFFLMCITHRFYVFLLHHTVCGILVPQPGIEPGPTAVKAYISNAVPSGESLSRRVLMIQIVLVTISGIINLSRHFLMIQREQDSLHKEGFVLLVEIKWP